MVKHLMLQVFLLLLFRLDAASPGFYFWQREFTPRAQRAVAEALTDHRPISALAAEFSMENGRVRQVAGALPPAFYRRPEITAVFRGSVDFFLTGKQEELLAAIQRLQPINVELDIDVPERCLTDYAAYLKRLRVSLPASVQSLSATALPCHLSRREFADVAGELDFFVLQLHGIAAPRSLNEPFQLLDEATAKHAIQQAKQLETPCKIALPTYGYLLYFEAESGRFQRLSAAPLSRPGEIRRLAEPDWGAILRLRRDFPELPVIWFRLPVEGDTLNLDRTTVARLENGIAPSPHLEYAFRRSGANAFDLYVTPRERLNPELRLTIAWPLKEGEFELAPGVKDVSSRRGFGILPDTLYTDQLRCGEPFRLGTILTDQEPIPIFKESANQ